MVALSALVSGLDAELVRLGYKDTTMLWYRGCWRRLARFFAAVGVEEFSLDLAMAWVDEACDFFGKERAGTLKPTDVYLFRVAQMLGDYAAHGAVLRRYSRTTEKVTGGGADLVARFQAWLRDAVANTRIADQVGVSPATVSAWRSRFTDQGMAKIGQVRKGRGRKATIPQAKIDEIVELTKNSKPDGETHWSCRTMAKKVGVSPATVQRVWSARGLKPHLVKTFKLSNDPKFEEKLIDVVGLYLDPPVRHEAPTDRVG